ncbi:MAG TPA: HAMP domain-containing sensor histidine kinase, partial [Nevskiaceae bacterium]|nr:HAMP domain-containing sensor histidine kinase [Nevskiaceae bacterium]
QPYLHYQIWAPRGSLLLRSHQAPLQPMSPTAAGGLSDQQVNGDRWRVYVVASARSGLSIQIGEPYMHRREAGQGVILVMLITMGVCSAVLLLALSTMIDRIAAQMGRSVREIGERSAADLTPLPAPLLPTEFGPLLLALNGLLTRLEKALAQERRFAADASHELRTPLAVIKTQAQIARRARHPAETEQALQKLEAGVDRAVHLVEQLLAAARIEPMAAQGEPAVPIDVRAEVQQLLDTYRNLIERRGMRVQCDIADSRWRGNPALARVLLRNLFDNALRYGGGEVRLRYSADADGQVLQVLDDGPGIAPDQRERVFDPFYRVPGAAGNGSGLGLAIVRQIVSAIGGRIELGAGIGGDGLGVSVYLPAAD